MTTDLRPRESQSHRLSIGFVIDLPALRHDKMCQFIYSLFLIDLIKTINLVLIKINKKIQIIIKGLCTIKRSGMILTRGTSSMLHVLQFFMLWHRHDADLA